jgi:hypothetical protein
MKTTAPPVDKEAKRAKVWEVANRLAVELGFQPVDPGPVAALCSLLSALCSLLSALCSLLSALCSLLLDLV